MKKYYVGVDVSKKTLDISIYDKVSNLPENYLRVSNNVSGFRDFSRWLKSKKIKFGEVVLCMEYTGVYNLEFCVFLESSRVDYSLVSGLVIKRSLGIQRGKNDNGFIPVSSSWTLFPVMFLMLMLISFYC